MNDSRNSVKQVPFNWGTFIASAIGFLIAAILGSCVFATRVFPQDAPNWNGPFVQLQQSIVTNGSNDLSFENGRYGFNLPLYEMGLEGKNLRSLALGYRHELGESGFYAGLKGGVHFGSFAGFEEWSAHDGDIGARVDFASKTLYTFGLELGAELGPKVLGYVGAGIAAADMTLCGQAHVLEHSVSECATGFAPGWYGSAGALVNLKKGWAAGVEMQFLHFEGEEEVEVGKYNLGYLKMNVDEFLIKVTLEKRF